MQPLCERCGRPVSSAPGAPDGASCACPRDGAGAREAAPAAAAGALPGRHEGSVEVDPWSLPPPEGGYENLDIELDPTGPQELAAPAAEGGAVAAAPAAATAAPDVATSVARAADAEPGAPARRRPAVLAGLAAAAIAVVAGGWLLLRGGAPSARAGVRVTVTEEVPWTAPPPLAPIDPSYVERRPAAERVRAGASPGRSAGRGSPRATSSQSPAPAAPPEPTPAAIASAAATEAPAAVPPPPEPVTEAPPPAPSPAAAPAEIPLPPPPVIPAKHEVPAASVRAPVLQTRTCVADALRLPAGLEGSLPGEVALNVQVADDGRPSDVAFPGNIDPRLRAALLSAVRTCRFAPAQDAGGRAAPGRATIRLRFEP